MKISYWFGLLFMLAVILCAAILFGCKPSAPPVYFTNKPPIHGGLTVEQCRVTGNLWLNVGDDGYCLKALRQ